MIKNTLTYIFLCVIVFSAFTTTASAQNEFTVVEKYDPQNLISQGPYYDGSPQDSVIVRFSGTQAKKMTISSYNDDSFTTAVTTKTFTSSTYYVGGAFTCNTNYIAKWFDSNGTELFRIKIIVTGLANPSCNSTPSDKDEAFCDTCDMFDCPGWNTYMSKLDEIKAAIPPEPNWQQVSETFRDTITPKIKSDMAELIGETPDPPIVENFEKATPPPTPPKLSTDDFWWWTATGPKGEETPELAENDFTANDVKNQAPTITEKEDPTKGFTITDPIGSLPSEEEFIKNVPSPQPENIAPIPNEESSSAPIPNQESSAAPIPNQESSAAPIPNQESSAAPIPNQESSAAPIP